MKLGVPCGITHLHTMKTAISLEDHLMLEADRAARELGVSRSRLVSLALKEYLRNRENDRIVEQLNTVYADLDSREKRVLPQIKAKFRQTSTESW